ncbi:3-hydroxybutyryl-CoA dehydrogenase [Flavobacteriaceae bacterium]|jgi:3-hydroxybutyryl-CoA dehydrogenase|nr:3-hydroxybutyryl-CoA dehydrogenase [Bacteroidota bacterium]MDA9215388.1 3-hydroxybutyryl-CoA dehydrogenase [Flavobacteriaceae bacterium]MDG1501385.1 3-hydroxybutyryl-CoA dehydrogenase [Ulvibacter sp.]MBT5871481.1 3-hydroxybutyryl-CoA dehydrogenase [Bacteroidota bacterium]MBT7306223.1 3-hydroxybutyryl-CoA dehydrogenase [Bacteroidota bacterium]|tara:strand:- start:600 stop:1487 length:888 start_codon:yes stop_codon:yes gene_type:complete
MKNVAVIGAGTMGNGIAHTFAQNDYKVQLIDVSRASLDRGLATIAKNLDRMVAKEKISEADKAKTLNNITTFTDLKTGVEYASLVVEAATENLDLKLKIFRDLEAFCPDDTIMASNTSSISITEIAAVTTRPDMVIGMHFMNPVPVMKLVEIIKGYSTSDQTYNTVAEISKKLGKIPVKVNDYPGFVANRILMPMINEAIETLYNGVAGVKEIDTVMMLGMAHPMGPLALADFIGLDVCLSILNVMYDGFKNPKYAPCPLLVNMVMAGKLGVKSAEGFYDYSNNRKAVDVAKMFC